jgi:hypothetical protein
VGQDSKRYTSRPQTGRPAPASGLADRFHKTLGAEEFPARLMNSLFCRKNSLFPRKKIPVLSVSGNLLQRHEIAWRIDVKSAEIAVFAGNFSKFPVIFPVLREFEDRRRSCLHGQDCSIDSNFGNAVLES